MKDAGRKKCVSNKWHMIERYYIIFGGPGERENEVKTMFWRFKEVMAEVCLKLIKIY